MTLDPKGRLHSTPSDLPVATAVGSTQVRTEEGDLVVSVNRTVPSTCIHGIMAPPRLPSLSPCYSPCCMGLLVSHHLPVRSGQFLHVHDPANLPNHCQGVGIVGHSVGFQVLYGRAASHSFSNVMNPFKPQCARTSWACRGLLMSGE